MWDSYWFDWVDWWFGVDAELVYTVTHALNIDAGDDPAI